MAPATLSLLGPPLRVNDDAARRLPPSSQRIFGLLAEAGAMTHGQVAASTGMPPRTIRFAVRRLREAGLVSSVPSLRDCRTCYLFVNRERNPDGAPAPGPRPLASNLPTNAPGAGTLGRPQTPLGIWPSAHLGEAPNLDSAVAIPLA